MELAIRLNNKCDLWYGVLYKQLAPPNVSGALYPGKVFLVKFETRKIKCTNAFKVVEFLLFSYKFELLITQADLDDPNHPAYQVTEAQVKDIENAVDSHIMKNENNRI